jgi:hypothetical protein
MFKYSSRCAGARNESMSKVCPREWAICCAINNTSRLAAGAGADEVGTAGVGASDEPGTGDGR